MSKDFYKIRVLGILLFLAVAVGFSAIAMLLWNWLMPEIFNLPAISYLQALGLFVLFRIFFGGLGYGFWGRWGIGFTQGNKLREKWMNMSGEEREAFVKKEKDFRNLFHDWFSHLRQFHEETETNTKKEGVPPKEDSNE
jgi:ABC-type multidrug transport system fused ATPase/permease subunit